MIAKLLTEFLGVFFLVLVIALTWNPIAIGVVLMVCVFMGAHISWAHYNPAVSLWLWMQKAINWSTMLQYWMVQMLWWIVAILTAKYLIGSSLLLQIWEGYAMGQAMVVEVLFTMLLVLVIYNVAIHTKTKNNQFYWIAIGLTILAAAFAWGWISWWAFNPAVGLSSMIVWFFEGSDVSVRRLYLVWPMLGWVLASLVYSVQKMDK